MSGFFNTHGTHVNVSGVASPNGPGGPGPHHFLTVLQVKAYVGPTIFWGIQGPIIIGPHQFQKRDYTPALVSIIRQCRLFYNGFEDEIVLYV